MTLNIKPVVQPISNSSAGTLRQVFQESWVNRTDIAAAYITNGGVRDVVSAMKETEGKGWKNIKKRWLTSFDYCRTEPLALEILSSVPNSQVRVHNAYAVLANHGSPRVPFHPKAFLFRGLRRKAVLLGSGNVSRSGLNTGYELGILFDHLSVGDCQNANAKRSIRSIEKWYESIWGEATILTEDLLNRYTSIHQSVENRTNPVPTEDDVAPEHSGTGSIDPRDLRKLRICKHYWVEAGNITKNRGRHLPGNQLMLKRLSRVYFGVPPTDVPQNSPLTRVQIGYGNVMKSDCSLTFSDNGMDKLTLPIPEPDKVPAYDQKNLFFTRLGPDRFLVELGTEAQKRRWIRKSKEIDASFTMPSGRKWGVF